MIKIAVIGAGYVGLVTGCCFSDSGNEVICVDIDEEKIKQLNSGVLPIYEPGLESIFLKNSKIGRLRFTTDLDFAVINSDIIFLALPTPSDSDGSADLKYILNVAEKLGKIIDQYKIIVNKSTVPVGTADKVKYEISRNYKGDFDVISNPEFLREGVAIDDFMSPDRIVIGTQSEKAKELIGELYSPFLKNGNKIIFMDIKSAELTKYAANSFLATKISFMNEIAQLCEIIGADVSLVRNGIGSDTRIGFDFLNSGIGYGGSCFPKDVQALIKTSNELKYDFKILKAVEQVNNIQKNHLISVLKNYYGENLRGKKASIWGLAFKPNTDDIREAPSLVLISELLKLGIQIKVYDPIAMNAVNKLLGNEIEFSSNAYDALEDSNFLIIATEWQEFLTPDFRLISENLIDKFILDGRGIYDKNLLLKYGLIHFKIGNKFF